MKSEKYLFYFFKDNENEIRCEDKLGKRHVDCIDEVKNLINLDITDNNVETMIIKMLERGYLCLMFFGAIYLFLPDLNVLNEHQIKFIQSLDFENILKVKGYTAKKLPYPGRFIDYQIEAKIQGKNMSVEEIISDLLIKNKSL